MALTGPPLVMHSNDEEDADFFDQLAHDLGHSDGLQLNWDKGEGEAFSKVNISNGDVAFAGMSESGIVPSGICMQETVLDETLSENSALCTTEITQGVLEAGFITRFNKSTVLEASEMHTSPMDASDGSLLKADVLTPCDAPLEADDLQEHVSNEAFNSKLTLSAGSTHSESGPCHYAVQNGDVESTPILSADSLNFPSDLVPSDDHQVRNLLSSQSTVKELQWSCFSEIYTEGEGPIELNDFLSELDAGTGSLADQSFEYCSTIQASSPIAGPLANSNSLLDWKAETGNLLEENNIAGTQLHGNGTYGIPNQLENHQSQASSDKRFNYQGTNEQPLGEPGVDQRGIRLASFMDSVALDNHSTAGSRLLQHYEVLSTVAGIQNSPLGAWELHGGTDTINGSFVADQQGNAQETLSTASSVQHSSLGDSQLHGGSHTMNGSFVSEQQTNVQDSWESMYPGWYFDYSSNQWKQVEGWDFTTGSMAVENHVFGSAVGLDSQSSSSTANATSSHSDLDQAAGLQMGFRQISTSPSGFIKAIDKSQSVLPGQASYMRPAGQEEPALPSLGSFWEGQSLGAEQATLGRDFEVAKSNEDSQYQVQVPWEEQYPGWYFDYQTQQWQQVGIESNQSLLHGDSSGVEMTGVAGDLAMQSEHQQEINKNVYSQDEGSVAYDHGGDKLILTQNLSFHGWESAAMAISPNEFAGGITENVKGTFQFENSGHGYGPQTHSSGVSQLYNRPDTQETFDNKLSFNYYSSHQSNESYNSYEPARETKLLTIERPSHPLVAFGFGGKLVTMKASSTPIPETVVLHDLNQLVLATEKIGQNDGVSYFSSLNRGGLAGPLVGGGLTIKELMKWVDDQIAVCDSDNHHQCISAQAFRVLWGVLRIACSHYGKLRSVHGSNSLKTQAEEGPEIDLGKLLSAASCHGNGIQNIASSVGLPSVSEQQLQSTAFEIKRHLMDGKRKEALQLAQQGHLWGPALVLAWHLGEKAYAETVLQMVQQQFVLGSPLRTLFLLFGGQTAELFTTKSLPAPVTIAGPDSLSLHTNTKDSAGGMLGDWMGNLGIVAANPTNGDEQVITHLGDCLWKDYGEVAGAHTCYLVADASFEPFSENARLCLVGADHFKWQRTFATPTSIQRTELYEYAKALGNPQFTLLSFQPYKLLYAYMLVEAGKVAEARRYCQAVTKSLKNAGRAPEVEFCRQSASALEERLRLHAQGGYNLNSATGKLVGKFMGTLDSTLHRIMGGPPPRQVSEPSLNKNPRDWYSNDQKAGNPAKVMEATVPTEKLSRFNHRPVEAPSRSVSEPNLSWSPMKNEDGAVTNSEVDDSSLKVTKEHVRTGYLGRFGSQLFTKAIGFIKSNNTKANLGDENKFYYNKDLKKWVEEGAEQTMEDVPLPPPPITAVFKPNGGSALHDAQSGGKLPSPDTFAGAGLSSSTEVPPLPPSGNQFSARGRLNGVRSRYVDTFNKGGALPAKPTGLPLVPTAGWGMTPPPTQFFMPAHTPTPNFGAEASDQRPSESMSASSTTENNQVGSEKGGILPMDSSSSSLTAVLPWQNHSTYSLPNGTAVELSKNNEMKLDGSMNAVQGSHHLPVPPFIEPSVPSLKAENGISGNLEEPWKTKLPGSVQGGILTDMQDVEL